MIGALAIKNRRKKLGLNQEDEQGPAPVPSPLANRVHMCYFVAACCIVISIVISIPAIVSDSSLFYYVGLSGGIGIIFFLVTCFLSPPSESSRSREEQVPPPDQSKVDSVIVSKPKSLLPSSPSPSAGKVPSKVRSSTIQTSSWREY